MFANSAIVVFGALWVKWYLICICSVCLLVCPKHWMSNGEYKNLSRDSIELITWVFDDN